MAVHVQNVNISPLSRCLDLHHGLWDLEHACLWAKRGHGAGSMKGLGSPEREGDEDTLKAAAEGITRQHRHALEKKESETGISSFVKCGCHGWEGGNNHLRQGSHQTFIL